MVAGELNALFCHAAGTDGRLNSLVEELLVPLALIKIVRILPITDVLATTVGVPENPVTSGDQSSIPDVLILEISIESTCRVTIILSG